MTDDYDVGYGKPPKATRFRKGQSGNPKGKPKGSRDFLTELAEELDEQVLVTENGKQRKYSKRRLVLKGLINKAVKGDIRAAIAAIKLMQDHPDLTDTTEADLSESDKAILADFLKRNTDGDNTK